MPRIMFYILLAKIEVEILQCELQNMLYKLSTKCVRIKNS